MTKEPKKMSVAEFRELGYLQELNRLLLHPLGLALEVEILPDGTERFGGVWDSRDDPEGFVYGPGMIDPKKVDFVHAETVKRSLARLEKLGYGIQPKETRG